MKFLSFAPFEKNGVFLSKIFNTTEKKKLFEIFWKKNIPIFFLEIFQKMSQNFF